MKTPLRYPGGKSRVADYIVSLFPKGFTEYREPFLGGGSVFLKTKEIYGNDISYWINDLYYDVYAFWVSMRGNESGVMGKVKALRNNFENGKDLYKHLVDKRDDFDQMTLAAAFFVLNRITFSGTSLSGGYSQESFDKRFTESSIKRLGGLGKELHGVRITNFDYSNLLDGNDENVFVFLDPPYYSAEDSALYGRNGDKHKGFDHERLKRNLDGCCHKWLMTYDDCGYIRNLYKDYNVKEFEFSYGMRNAGGGNDMKGKELLISNYDISDRKSVELF